MRGEHIVVGFYITSTCPCFVCIDRVNDVDNVFEYLGVLPSNIEHAPLPLKRMICTRLQERGGSQKGKARRV